MKQLRKKALLPALSMALASVIALSGVTYAWFTTSPTAQVSGMDVNVQSANGIQISLDAATWKSNITAQDILNGIAKQGGTYTGSANQYPTGEIAPVSTAGNITSEGKMEMFYGEIDKNGNLTTSAQAEKETSTEGNFIAFDLFVKSASPQKLKLNLGDSLSRVKGIIVGSDASNEAGTEKAVRVAFLDLGNSATAAGARGLKGNDKTKAVIWEPNSATRAAGVEAESGKLNYFGINSEIKEGKALNDLGASATEITDTFDETKDIVELETGINKIRVYIWLEGQDVDCVNEISFGDFSVNLAFSVPEDANT